MNDFLTHCGKIIGTENVLIDPIDQAPYLTEWRQRASGKALAILKPSSTQETADLVKLCIQHQICIVPQGGNTGLVLGSIPNLYNTDQEIANTIVLSLKRLQTIRYIDTANNTMTVEAGCLLEQLQIAADKVARLFPLSLASEGSCTIGGNLSTNAGGTGVIRYGNVRDLCLGLEVVTAQGEIWNGLRGLRKDNSGYDLRDLFIGAEGTLGVITAAVLKLFPKPRCQITAFLSFDDVSQAVAFLTLTQEHCHTKLTAFELMNAKSLELVHQHFPQYQKVLHDKSSYYVLLELSSNEDEEITRVQIEHVIAAGIAQHCLIDAAIAQSEKQSKNCWAIRESISAAQAKQGKNIKHDISLPISNISRFISETDLALHAAFPGCEMVTFGHLGDGNLHYNISAPAGTSDAYFLSHQSEINQIVYEKTHTYEGSFSAEHGIGMLKKEELLRYKSPIEIAMMRSIKQALDPQNMMNPGKIL